VQFRPVDLDEFTIKFFTNTLQICQKGNFLELKDMMLTRVEINRVQPVVSS